MHTSSLNISKVSSSLCKVIKEFSFSGGTRFGGSLKWQTVLEAPPLSPLQFPELGSLLREGSRD